MTQTKKQKINSDIFEIEYQINLLQKEMEIHIDKVSSIWKYIEKYRKERQELIGKRWLMSNE